MTTITQVVARLLFAPVLVVAAAVLVKGYTSAGDGFSAGVLAAIAVLLQGVAFGRARIARVFPLVRAVRTAVGGLLLSLGVAIVPLLRGAPFFTHAPGPGTKPIKLGTLELITPVAFDVGVFLLVTGTLVVALHLLAPPEGAEA